MKGRRKEFEEEKQRMKHTLPARRKDALLNSPFDAILLFSGDFRKGDEDFFYFTGSHVDSCVLLLRRKKPPVLFSSKMLLPDAKKLGIKTVRYDKKKPYQTLLKYLKGASKIGISYSSITLDRFHRLKKGMPKKKFLDCGRHLLLLRMLKEKGEVEKIREAQRLTEAIISSIKLSPSKTEEDVANELLLKTAQAGCTPAFPPIVASGPSGAGAHHPPGKRRLSGCILIDYGVKKGGYCGDMTRCFFLGKCREEREAYSRLQKISKEIMGAIPRLKNISELDTMHNSLLKKYNLPAPIHLLGHGIGLEVHELPSIHSRAKETVQPGQVFTIEPGAYFPGKFGVRHENIIHYDGKRVRVL